MNQQPDKLFRDKLENFQKPISTNAWSRIENNLGPKKSSFIILKVAAVVAVVIGLGWWLMTQNTADALKQAEVEIIKPTQTEKTITPSQQLPSEEKATLAEVKPKSLKTPRLKRNDTPSNESALKDRAQDAVPLQSENTLLVAETESQEKIIKEETVVVPEQTNVKVLGNTFVLSAEEVNAKYLHHENLQDEATPANKKPSTLQRLLNKVSDLKNNQDPLGELRQKKDEILALNFKSEKQRNQNR